MSLNVNLYHNHIYLFSLPNSHFQLYFHAISFCPEHITLSSPFLSFFIVYFGLFLYVAPFFKYIYFLETFLSLLQNPRPTYISFLNTFLSFHWICLFIFLFSNHIFLFPKYISFHSFSFILSSPHQSLLSPFLVDPKQNSTIFLYIFFSQPLSIGQQSAYPSFLYQAPFSYSFIFYLYKASLIIYLSVSPSRLAFFI